MKRKIVFLLCFMTGAILLGQWIYFKYSNLSNYVTEIKNEKELIEYQAQELANGLLSFDRLNSVDFFDSLVIKNNLNQQTSINEMLTLRGQVKRIVYIPYNVCNDCFSQEFNYIRESLASRDDINVIFQCQNFQEFQAKCKETGLCEKSYYSRLSTDSREIKNILIFRIDNQSKIEKTSLLVSKYASLNKTLIEENLALN